MVMLLITGASGAGKSTARRLAAPRLLPGIECVELFDVVEIPAQWDIRWRQESTEAAVRYALELQADGRNLMLAGDPVAVGELLAVPSAIELDAIAACLLDVEPDAQTSRLSERGDDLTVLHHHHAFAEWMRRHVRDPQYMQNVIMDGSWDQMRWDRWADWESGDPRWRFREIDTSNRSIGAVADQIVAWARAAVEGDSAPVLRGRWWES